MEPRRAAGFALLLLISAAIAAALAACDLPGASSSSSPSALSWPSRTAVATASISDTLSAVQAGHRLSYMELEDLLLQAQLDRFLVPATEEPTPVDEEASFNAAYGKWEALSTAYRDMLIGKSVATWHGWVTGVGQMRQDSQKTGQGAVKYVADIYMYDPYGSEQPRIRRVGSQSPDVVLIELSEPQGKMLKRGQRIEFTGAVHDMETYDGSVVLNEVRIAGVSDPKPVELPADITPEVLASTVITIQRTQCFGDCPVYKRMIKGDGTVLQTGVVTGTISQQAVRELVAEFYKADYFSLQDSYAADATDNPDANTAITMGGRTKAVRHNLSSSTAPRKLYLLEERIDDVIDARQPVR